MLYDDSGTVTSDLSETESSKLKDSDTSPRDSRVLFGMAPLRNSALTSS
jgi:hypothetical protein